MSTTSSPRPYRPRTPAPTATPAPAPTPLPSFRIDRDVQAGDTLEIVTENSHWRFVFHEPIKVSTMSPSAIRMGTEDFVRMFVVSKRSMTTTTRETNDNQPPNGPAPERHIVKGQPVFFGNWRADHGGDMRTGPVTELWHNGRRIF